MVLISLIVLVAYTFTIACALETESVRLPLLGLGTAGLRGKTHEIVLQALQIGVRMVDSAQAQEWYDERGVGTAVSYFESGGNEAQSTLPIIIVTKVHPRSFEYAAMNSKLLESRENFKRSHLDVVLLHAPWCWPGHCTREEEAVGWEAGWNNLVALKEEHKIGAIGVSNFHLELLQRLVLDDMGARVDVVQNWMDPFHQDREVRAFCAAHGVQYMAYSSFGTQWSRNPSPVAASPVLQRIAVKHNASVTKVVMAWLAAEGVVAIPRSSNPQHLGENFAALVNEQQRSDVCSNNSGDVSNTSCGEAETSVVLDEEDLSEIRGLDGTLGDPWD